MDQDARTPARRVSDAERDQGILLLRDALAEGRLTLEEFSDRVGAAQQARTEPELSQLTADLPAPLRANLAVEAQYRAAFSQLVRKDLWRLPASVKFSSWFGTIDLDFSHAVLEAELTEIEVFNLFGTVTMIVPEGIEVGVEGGGIFASQVIDPPAIRPPPGAPRLRIRVRGPGGTLRVRRREALPSRLTKLLGRVSGAPAPPR